MKLSKYVAIVLLVLSLSFIPTVSAGTCDTNDCYVNGTISRSDNGSRLVGALVYNTTNTNQNSTTNTNGLFNISGFGNNSNINITIIASGFTTDTVLNIVISGTNNTTTTKTLTIITPVQSSITTSDVTTTSGFVGWSLTNNYVSNRVRYSSTSSYLNTSSQSYSSSSNNTLSPLISLTGLSDGIIYYYIVDTYNIANTTVGTSSGVNSFTTKMGTSNGGGPGGGVTTSTPYPTATLTATPITTIPPVELPSSPIDSAAMVVAILSIMAIIYMLKFSKGRR